MVVCVVVVLGDVASSVDLFVCFVCCGGYVAVGAAWLCMFNVLTIVCVYGLFV